MAKYKLAFPEDRPFTGVYMSVAFAAGAGETDSDYLAERFREKGLSVEAESTSTQKPVNKMTVDELKAYAAEKGIALPDDGLKADLLAAIEASEKGGAKDGKDGD